MVFKGFWAKPEYTLSVVLQEIVSKKPNQIMIN